LKAEVQKEAESKNELISNVREQRGDRVKTGYNLKTGGVYRADGPRLYQNPAGFCWGEEVKENSRFASHQTEAEVLTLSPIPSPEKTSDSPGYAPLQEEVPLNDTVRGFTRRNRAHMESTAVSQPLFGVYRGQIHAVTPQITDSFSRIQPTESCTRSIFKKKSVPLNLRSPIGVYSPMKKRLRKCKLDPNDSEEAFRTTEESNEESGPPQARRKPAVIGGSTQNNTWRQDRFNVKGFPSDRPEPKFQEDENIQWNSNVITERISSSVLRTVSGRVYILLGRMNIKLANAESYPPSCSSINVSRSGRVIKPPLEYWKGGRVILDAHMNVTIYKSYETSSPVSA
ncbi:hypothetical protein XENOCAPTIV_029518, partial [Xenoophorus captivus]